jgi:hypothetical protein
VKLWLLQISQGKDPSLKKQEVRVIPTVKELADKYMREHAPHKKASSQKEDKWLWNQYILPVFGALKVTALEALPYAQA